MSNGTGTTLPNPPYPLTFTRVTQVTSVLQLPQLSGTLTQFFVSRNADWTDSLFFAAPGFANASSISGCSVTRGTSTVTIPDTTLVGTGQPIQATPGIAQGAYVGNILTGTTFQMVDQFGVALNATASLTSTTLIFLPIPLDLTGIDFIACLRTNDSSKTVLFTAQTRDGTMINGGLNGTLSFNVPRTKMSGVAAGVYVMDILGRDPQYTVNLFAGGAAPVTVVNGISDVSLFK